ncbi:flagellar hook-associated protein FlgL [Paenibacillus sp. GCM10027628]|uniref:flagellar hook-associated protein FlgL n=1 Tax=Paenibacillus sp. GCM10027628 TaxID=3273413 RepID=UPI00363B0755
MTLRVTQGMMNMNLMRNLNSNLQRMDDLQAQLSSGRKINKPSDDPVGLSYTLRYQSEYGQNEQYVENLASAKSWMDNTDSTLDKANQVLQRMRELTVQASNGSNSQDALNSISSEVSQLSNELVSIGNTQFNGKYIFNGQQTDVMPYSNPNAAETVDVENSKIQFGIGTGVTLPINVTGDQVFGNSTDTDNVFAIAKQLVATLQTNNPSAISNMLGPIDSRMTKFLSVRAEVGAKMNRIDFADNRTQDTSVNLQSLISKTSDADIAGTLTNLKTAQNVYQASLSVGAKIIPLSLIDFLH